MQSQKVTQTTTDSPTSVQRDLSTDPMSGIPQDQSQSTTARSYQNQLESQGYGNYCMNEEKFGFESQHRSYSGHQLRGGGGDNENISTEEVQNQQLKGLLHKIDEYKRKIQGGRHFENELGTYMKPLGKLNRNYEDSMREPFELELELKKRLLNSDSDLKVALLSGEAGIGKSSFCKYLQRAMLMDWDESEWLPILVDLSNLMRSFSEKANLTISEILKKELSLTDGEIKFLQESERKNLHRPRFLFIFDEYDQFLRKDANSANQWTLEDCIQSNFCKSVGFEAFWNHAKIIITARDKALSHVERADLLVAAPCRRSDLLISEKIPRFECYRTKERKFSDPCSIALSRIMGFGGKNSEYN